MPDVNKFTKLREIGYTIPVTCGCCKCGIFKDGTDWGTCGFHQYQHAKHTGDSRGVSIIRFGTCPNARMKHGMDVILGAHQEFLR